LRAGPGPCRALNFSAAQRVLACGLSRVSLPRTESICTDPPRSDWYEAITHFWYTSHPSTLTHTHLFLIAAASTALRALRPHTPHRRRCAQRCPGESHTLLTRRLYDCDAQTRSMLAMSRRVLPANSATQGRLQPSSSCMLAILRRAALFSASPVASPPISARLAAVAPDRVQPPARQSPTIIMMSRRGRRTLFMCRPIQPIGSAA
jgi:hypothetical protein